MRNIYFASVIVVLLVICTVLYVLGVGITSLRYGYVFLLLMVAIYLLVLWLVYKLYKSHVRISHAKNYQSVINTITKSNGVQYTEYLVDKQMFVNLNKIGEGEYSEVSTDTLFAITYPADLTIVKEMVKRMNAGNNERMNFEYRLNLSYISGYSWRLVTIMPLELNANGKVVKYIGIDLRNDHSHKMTRELELFNKKILFMTRIITMIFVQYTRKDKLFSRLDMVGDRLVHHIPMDSWYAGIYPEDMEIAKDLIAFMDRGESGHYQTEYRYRYPTNEYRWFAVDIAAYERDENGRILSYMCLCTDIDERKRQLEREKELRRRADAANELKSSFIRNLSHEIRTPLNSIVGFSNLINKNTPEEDAQLFKQIIKKNNDQLLGIIDCTIDKSLIESGLVEIKTTAFPLKPFIEADFSKITSEEHAGITFLLQCGDDITVSTSKMWISRVIDHFMKNALAFTMKGTVTMGYENEEKQVRVYVKDEGIGISSEDQKRIFNDFEKVDTFSPGLGMGLPMCKSIITQLGGTIGVESELGKGSCFWFTIPL